MADLEKNLIASFAPIQRAINPTERKKNALEEIQDVLPILSNAKDLVNCDVNVYKMIDRGGMSYNDLVQAGVAANALGKAGVEHVPQLIAEKLEEVRNCVFERTDLREGIINPGKKLGEVVFRNNRLVAWQNTGDVFLTAEPQLLTGGSDDNEYGLVTVGDKLIKKEELNDGKWTQVEIMAIDWEALGIKALPQESNNPIFQPAPQGSIINVSWAANGKFDSDKKVA